MLGKIRPQRSSAAMVVALLALSVALSGTALGQSAVTAAKTLITGKQIANKSITGADIKNNSLTSAVVRNRSLLAQDFKRGQLPAGATGAKGDVGPQGPRGDVGPQGPPGPKGDPGTIDTSNFYDKAASDARFLGTTAKAADADKLDGRDASGFAQILDSGTKDTMLPSMAPGACVLDQQSTTAPTGRLVIPFGPIVNSTNTSVVAIPGTTRASGPQSVSAVWKVCNVSTTTMTPGTVTTSFVVLGP